MAKPGAIGWKDFPISLYTPKKYYPNFFLNIPLKYTNIEGFCNVLIQTTLRDTLAPKKVQLIFYNPMNVLMVAPKKVQTNHPKRCTAYKN
jgi:hypothetical protein